MQADVKTYLIFDFHRLKNIVHGIAALLYHLLKI